MHAVPAVFRSFHDDHRRVLARLDELERMNTQAGRRRRLGPTLESALREAVLVLERQFATHMSAEDQVLYPAVCEALPESLVSLEPLRVEHIERRAMLARVGTLLGADATPDRDEQIAVQMQDLIDLLRIHIRKEEAAVFQVAAQVLTPGEITRLEERVAAHLQHRRPDRRSTKGTLR